GLLSFHPTQTGAWSAFDGDGWLDLYIGNESTDGDPNPSELYMNDRDGTFTECAAPAGVDVVAFVKGVTSADYNDDGRPDLYLSIRGEPNRLYRNEGVRRGENGRPERGPCTLRFTDVARAAGVTEPIFSFPTWFFDYDNDGHEDLFVSGYMIHDVGDVAADVLGLPSQGETLRLYHNRGDGTFENVTRAAGLQRVVITMGSNFGDLDNDGWLDMHLGTGDPDLGTLVPNRTFRNDGGRRFQDITTSAGTGHLQKGHGVAFADLDEDGDLDLYEVIGGAFEADHFRNALYENPGQGNTWVEIELEGVRANRPGIGARLRLVAATPRGTRTITRTLNSGGSFGASPLRAWFGLGDASAVVSLEIRWPGSGTAQVLRGLRCGQRYRVREGEATPEIKPRNPVHLGAPQDQVAKR
ncbi:MAG TPA: CRTAC1 family protein, partial [Candidatus Polarisedimenticolia bacterium]|nr:CRTAC1 family protein [Candidatus Polarisedimenticolia bacterium]